MNKRLLVLLIVIVLLTVGTFPALASPSENASGEWYYLPDGPPAITKVVGGNTFMTISDTGNWTGTITGDEVDVGKVVIHRNDYWFYTGEVSFASVVVDGKAGGLEMSVQGRRPDALSEWEGKWLITGGTGELAGLRGQGTWEGPGWLGDPTVPGVVYYTGNIHFEGE